jgi:hypothetical protein
MTPMRPVSVEQLELFSPVSPKTSVMWQETPNEAIP